MSTWHAILCIACPLKHLYTWLLDPIWSCLAKLNKNYWNIIFKRDKIQDKNMNHIKNTKTYNFLYDIKKNKNIYAAHNIGLNKVDITFIKVKNEWFPKDELFCQIGTSLRLTLYNGWFILTFNTKAAMNKAVVIRNKTRRFLNILIL